MALTDDTVKKAALKTELQDDPLALGYAAAIASGNDQVVADLANRVRNSINVARSNVAPQEVIEAIAVNQFAASITTIQASWFESFTQLPSVQLVKVDGAGAVTDTRVMTNLLLLLTNGSSSETRVRALATRKGSRIEQLFGEFASITSSDVAVALRG